MQINRFLFEIKCANTLGESVLWHTGQQAVYWTDIQSKTLYKCIMSKQVASLLSAESTSEKTMLARDEYLNQVLQVFDLPERLGSFAFTDQADLLLAGFANGVASYQYATKHLCFFAKPEKDNSHIRFNGGKCDPQGRFWLGSMVQDGSDIKKLATDKLASLYRFDQFDFVNNNVSAHSMLSEIQISNGICFSDDGLTLYHTDSATHKIYQYALNFAGDILACKLFTKFDKNSFPSGACVDMNGNVWIALWGAACVVCINSKGKEILRHPLPVTQGTCLAIGGPDMNWLFVTSAKQGLSKEKRKRQARAGNLFVYEISESVGRPENIVCIKHS